MQSDCAIQLSDSVKTEIEVKPNCYRCGVVLTNEYGWRASNAARWHSYKAKSYNTCKGCCEELERQPKLQEEDELERARR